MTYLPRFILFAAVALVLSLRAGAEPANESEYLAGRVQENVRRLVQYALKRQVDWKTDTAPATPVMSSVWAPESYQAYIKSMANGVQNDSSEVTLKTTESLLDPTAYTMAQLSQSISSALQEHPTSAELHEHAAMLNAVLILREASGRFYDTRELLCRATAHLAFARYLKGEPTSSGIVAKAVMEAEQGHAVKALQLAQSLPDAMGDWKLIISMRVTGDWRNPAKSNAILYRILYTQAFLAASNGQASQRMVDGIRLQDGRIQGRTDWYRSFLQDPPSRKFVLNKLNEALQLEGAEMTGVMTTFKIAPATSEASIDLMNKPPGYIVSPDAVGMPQIVVLDWGTWAAHYQRHLSHNLMFVLGEQMIERKFHGLMFYPFIILQQRRQSNGLKRQIFKDALALVRTQPQRVNAVNRMQLAALIQHASNSAINPFVPLPSTPYLSSDARNKPTLGFMPAVVDLEDSTSADDDWITRLPTGSYYRASERYELLPPSLVVSVGEADAYNPFYARQRVVNAEDDDLAALDGIAGPRANYDIHVMETILRKLPVASADYLTLLGRISQISPSAALAEANLHYRAGSLDKAAQVFDNAVEEAVPPKLVADSALWMIDYLQEKGDLERALQLAETAAGSGGVLHRQRYIRLLGSLDKRDEAEKTVISMQKHFPMSVPLIRFYVQMGRLNGSTRGERNVSTALGEIKYRPRLLESERKAAFDAAQAVIFPGGKVPFRALPGPPPIGLNVQQAKAGSNVSAGDTVVAFNSIALHDVFQYHFLRRESDAAEAVMTLWNKGRGYYTASVNLKEWDEAVTLAFANVAGNQLAQRIAQARKTGKLNLARMGLNTIPKEVFELTGVKALDLSGNPLTGLPGEINTLEALESLDASNCALKALPTELSELKNLINLKVGGNNLTSLPESLDQLPKLELLNLKENDFSEFPLAATRIKTLKYLVLSNNQIATLPDQVSQLDQLKALSLGRNRFDAFPEQLLELAALQKLVLLDNRISVLPQGINQMQGLTRLDMRGNQLNDLPKTLPLIKGLAQLQLGNNRFVDLPDSLWELSSLTELDLGGNGLTEISPAIEKLKRLKLLVISSNRLSKFPPTLPEMPALRKVDYGGNYFMPEHTLVIINMSKNVTFSGNTYE